MAFVVIRRGDHPGRAGGGIQRVADHEPGLHPAIRVGTGRLPQDFGRHRDVAAVLGAHKAHAVSRVPDVGAACLDGESPIAAERRAALERGADVVAVEATDRGWDRAG